MPLTFNFGEENRPELFEGKPKTPVTLLSGFLGTGKTSLLKHLLENQEGVRIGVVVNDVAAVNIDSQLVKRYETGLVEVTELQNGCVCCSSADDLFTAVQNIVMRSKDHCFEHIVVELSGIGEPEAVKKNWAIGLECTMPVALRTEVKQVVTVVDASTFGKDWLDTRQAQHRNEEVQGDSHDEKNKARLENVGQLLAEQVEWADVIVLNKTDLASQEELHTTEEVVRALNPHAAVNQAEFGRVSPHMVLPKVPRGLKVADSGQGNGYTWTQTSSEIRVMLAIAPEVKGKDVDFKVGKQKLRLGVRGRAQPKAEGILFDEVKNLDDCMFEIEGLASDRHVVVALEKRRPVMWGGLFHGQEAPDHDGEHRCSDAHCTDSSHNHGHDRKSAPQFNPPNRAEQRFGIHSFVYQRRRPFSAQRLEKLLTAWPTLRKELFTLGDLDLNSTEQNVEAHAAVLRPILRSKGFCWVDNEPLRQHIWSHAGSTMAVKPADWWWAALDADQLKFKVSYPGVEAEYKQTRKEKWDSAVGDRRQELVFIGGPQMSEQDILPLLEECLLSNDELLAFQNRSKSLKVPIDDFHVNGLLKNLGASQEEIEDITSKSERDVEAERLKRKQDREETDFLRTLGVGSALEGESEALDDFEAID